MDHFSYLPKTILHDILSRLPEKDAARTSVLSKAWAETWSTFPFFYISDSQILHPTEDCTRIREIFLNYVTKKLLRFHNQGLAIKKFNLTLDDVDIQNMSQDFDLWLKMASECGYEVLELNLPMVLAQDQVYILPMGVIEAKSLKELVLTGIRVDQAFLNHSIKLFSLQKLSLRHVLLGDKQAIEHLISHCPLIEYVNLEECYVLNNVSIGDQQASRTSRLKSIKMLNLQKLKSADVGGIQEVYIDAPNLEKFTYWPYFLGPYAINFDSCRNLRELQLWRLKMTTMTDSWFLELFSKFPFLQSLSIVNCSISEIINISSVQLKFLELSKCANLKEANIDAPNLSRCRYYGNGLLKPIISFLRYSGSLEVHVTLNMEYMYLHNLRELVQNFKPSEVLAPLTLFIHEPSNALNPDELLVSSPPPSIKHLYLHAVPKNKSLFLPLVNSLLSSCCPGTISMSLFSGFCSRAFIGFLYEKLVSRNGDGCYCSSMDTKCWWHGLKDVKVTSSVKIDDNVDFKTMLDSLPNCPVQENISFRLEL